MGSYIKMGNIYWHMQANAFIDGLRRWSLLKAIVPQQLKHLQKVKLWFGVGGILISTIKKMITVGLSVLVLSFMIPTMLFHFFEKVPSQVDLILLFVGVHCIVPALTQSAIFRLEKEDHMYLNYFKVDPNQYYRYKIIKLLSSNTLFMIPALCYVFKDDWKLIAILSLIKVTTSILGNCIFTWIYHKNKAIPKVWARLWMGGIITCAIYFQVMFCEEPRLKSISESLESLLIGFIVMCCIGGYRWLMGYKGYLGIARKYANKDVVALRVSITSTPQEDTIALNKSTWKKNLSYYEAHKGRSGFDYLNVAFIERHQKVINQFYRSRAILSVIVGSVIGGALKYKGIVLDMEILRIYSPWMISFVLFFSFGKAFCQMLFYHCDCYLLSQRIYKDKETVYHTFLFRMKYLLRKTLGTGIALGIGMMLMMGISGSTIGIKELMLFYSVGISILIFYETYHLVAYYLVQPYSKEAMVKNPVYKLLSWIELCIGLLCLVIRENITAHCIYIVFFTIVFVVTGTMLVKKYGMKCFKLC